MDDKLKGKVSTLVKSMYKNVQKSKVKTKDVIEDVLDEDRIAEISPDDVAPNKSGTLKKGKEIKKGEDFVADFLNKFEKISKAYLMEKARVDDLEPSASKRRAARGERGSRPNVKTAKNKKQMRDEKGNAINEWKDEKGAQAKLKTKLKDKKIKSNKAKGVDNQPSKEDLEYPTMAASEKN
tara:strand:- start:2422 stop:2964 length:543 start_codon:yes stop_codon:yes gene_type:complete